MSNEKDLLDMNNEISSQGNGSSNYQKPLPQATAVLVLGICSIVGCLFYGLPGLVCGIIALFLHTKDKRVYLQNPVAYEMSYKNSRAGFVCAVVGTSISGFTVLIVIMGILLGTASRSFL